jgi:hypothetical protein
MAIDCIETSFQVTPSGAFMTPEDRFQKSACVVNRVVVSVIVAMSLSLSIRDFYDLSPAPIDSLRTIQQRGFGITIFAPAGHDEPSSLISSTNAGSAAKRNSSRSQNRPGTGKRSRGASPATGWDGHARIPQAWRGGTRPFMLADRRAMKVRVAPRWREDDMFQSMLRRSVPVLTLATILFITCAGTAQARTFTPAEEAWTWLRQVWTVGGVGIWGGGEFRKDHGTSGAEKSLGANVKQPPTPSSSTPPPSTSADGGYGVDPNG